MTPDTKALIRDIKRAFKSRINSSSIGRKASSKSNWRHDAFKSTGNALAHREEGNLWYNDKEFQNALVWYTMSVASAFHDSEEQSKAYGNRSAVLFELQEYESCLLDINRALKGHCTNLVWRQKLLNRKKRCLAEIKSAAAAVNDGVSRIIDEDGTDPAPGQEPIWRADMLSKFGNPLLPNASPKIKLKYDTKWGRHFVATADIDPGEPLISEECFIASRPGGEIRFKFCNFCTTECHALIPCPSCASILYCSEQCRTMAYNQYHRMECKLLSALPIVHDGSPLDPAAVRLFLVGTKQGAALENLMNNLSVSDIFEENYNFAGRPFTSDYMAALRLKSIYDFKSISTKSRIEDAVEVIKVLRKLAFFESTPDNHLRDAEVFATALLLNNCRRKFTNKFAQGEGEGLILLQNMMNHSCHPNVESAQRKRENIMFCLRPIKKNEQLFCCYNQTFEYFPKPKRILDCMGFVCQCEACNENWPHLSMSALSSSEALLKIKESLQPKEEGSESLFAMLLNISAPLADDTALKNLEVREIVSVVAEIVSLLYKMMKPMSYPLIEFRLFLVEFVQYFYNERERDLSWNGKLSFPFPKDAWNSNDELRSILPTDARHRETTIRIYCVIRRLNFYIDRGHFVNKNIIG